MAEDSPPPRASPAVPPHIGTEYLISEDISRGGNESPVPCLSRNPHDKPPNRFTFIRTSHEVAGIIPGAPIISEGADGCKCEDDCSSLMCQCNQLSEGAAYYPWSGKLIESPYTTGRFDRLDIYECHHNCKCNKELCSNRETKRTRKWSFQVFKTLKKGWGLRSMQRIPAAFYVGEYAGEYVTLSKALRMDKTYSFNLQPRVDMVVDATTFGNHFRFVNHSCDPNLRTVIVFDHWDKRFPRICFFAIRDIMPLEELSVYYGTNFWFPKVAKQQQVSCNCGAPACLLKYTTSYRESIHYPLKIAGEGGGFQYDNDNRNNNTSSSLPLSIQSFMFKSDMPISLRKRTKVCDADTNGRKEEEEWAISLRKKKDEKGESKSGPRQAKRSQLDHHHQQQQQLSSLSTEQQTTLIEPPQILDTTLDLEDD